MTGRRQWTSKEDKLLTQIVLSQKNYQKLTWKQIANQMNKVLFDRNGKQCRERWFSQLRPDLNIHKEWTLQQEQILFSLQEQFGNSWSIIAKKLPGRSDNSVKNYFYSSLKKSLRKVNYHICQNRSIFKNNKQIKQITIGKILKACENRQELQNLGSRDVQAWAKDIKKLMVQCFKKRMDVSQDLLNELALQLYKFNKQCRTPKSRRNKQKSSAQTNYFKGRTIQYPFDLSNSKKYQLLDINQPFQQIEPNQPIDCLYQQKIITPQNRKQEQPKNQINHLFHDYFQLPDVRQFSDDYQF